MAPGPISKIIVPFTSRDGHARFALTAEPPEPRNVSFNATPTSVSFAVSSVYVCSVADTLELRLRRSCSSPQLRNDFVPERLQRLGFRVAGEAEEEVVDSYLFELSQPTDTFIGFSDDETAADRVLSEFQY